MPDTKMSILAVFGVFGWHSERWAHQFMEYRIPKTMLQFDACPHPSTAITPQISHAKAPVPGGTGAFHD
jgi:hypothetical protein